MTRTWLASLLPLTLATSALAAPPPLDSLHLETRMFRTSSGNVVHGEEGWLGVPERRGAAGTRTIPLRFVRLRSTASPGGTPLFYLAGGPGDTGTGLARDPDLLERWTTLLEAGDIVLIDQRGTRDPLLRWSWDGPLPVAAFTSADSARVHALRVAERASAAISARGVDLAGYNSVESAEDLEDLRLALRLPRISLLGFSYGTHLACAYLRAHGGAVANAVFVGTEGPSHTFKLPSGADTHWSRIALLAKADPAVSREIPDLTALLDRVLARLSRQPMVIHLEHPQTHESIPVAVGPIGLLFILRADLGDASDIPVFPRLLWSIDRGDTSVLRWFVAKRAGGLLGARGMSSATDAASYASPERIARIATEARSSRFGDVVNYFSIETAPIWCPEPLGEDFRSPLVSPVRSLFVSGTLDWNSPPHQAEELRWGFLHSTHIEVQNAGHEQTLWQNERAVPLLADFLKGQDVAGRRIDLPALRFVPLSGRDPAATHPSVE